MRYNIYILNNPDNIKKEIFEILNDIKKRESDQL